MGWRSEGWDRSPQSGRMACVTAILTPPILTSDEMRAVDRSTTEQFGIPSIVLMRHAGQAVARFVEREYPSHRRITVLCGKGNNGGDGFVAARALAADGREVSVLLLGDPYELKGDAKTAFEEMQLAPIFAPDESSLNSPHARAVLANADL